MAKSCDRCGGEGRWKTGVSLLTGKVAYQQCPKCLGKKEVDDDVPRDRPLTAQGREKLNEKLMRQNVERNLQQRMLQMSANFGRRR